MRNADILPQGFYLITSRQNSAVAKYIEDDILVPFGGEWNYPDKAYPLDMRFLVRIDLDERKAEILDHRYPDYGENFEPLSEWTYSVIQDKIVAKFFQDRNFKVYEPEHAKHRDLMMEDSSKIYCLSNVTDSGSNRVVNNCMVSWSDIYSDAECPDRFTCFRFEKLVSVDTLSQGRFVNHATYLISLNENLDVLKDTLISNKALGNPVFQVDNDDFYLREYGSKSEVRFQHLSLAPSKEF